MSHTVLFLCPHSAAKSVLAAAYFQRLADQRQLDVTATFAGTEPDPAVSPAVVELLRADGLNVTHLIPRRVTYEELTTAFRVVSLGCDLDDLLPPGTSVERWDDVPPPGENLMMTRDVIRTYVESFVDELKRLK